MKTAVVTGASSGIGLVVARELAKSGWRVLAHGRDRERAAAALDSIRHVAPASPVDMVLADLSVMAEAARFADEISHRTDRIDLLVNNAGFTPAARVESSDGYEQCFAANHLGPFLLTNRLLPLLRQAGPSSQIINTSSVAHRFIKDMLWDDLQQTGKFSAGQAYSQSKLANILHVKGLAKRLEGDGIRVNAVHPGVVQTNFSSHGNLVVRLMYKLGAPFALTSEQGADTILWLAQGRAPEATGQYFAKRKIAATTPAANSDAGVERLWAVSEDLVAQTGF
jgi:retinol dehydrogenase 12